MWWATAGVSWLDAAQATQWQLAFAKMWAGGAQQPTGAAHQLMWQVRLHELVSGGQRVEASMSFAFQTCAGTVHADLLACSQQHG